MNFRVSGLIIAAVAMSTIAVCHGGGDLAASEKAEQWERAAMNREWAAVVQDGQALDCVQQSAALRRDEYKDESSRARLVAAAAGLLCKAGDLKSAAWGNYNRAIKNWETVSGHWKKLEDETRYQQACERADAAKTAASIAGKAAADHYETAAGLYGDLGPSHASKAAKLSEKAASCRERLAAQ